MFRWRIGTDLIWRQLDRLQESTDDLFTTLTGTRRASQERLWRRARLFPPLNVREWEHSFVVTAEIPGMKTEDLEIKIEGDTLTLRGERKLQETGGEARYHRRERAVGTFQRSLTLPGKVDVKNVSATYKDGVLAVTLQKENAALRRQTARKGE